MISKAGRHYRDEVITQVRYSPTALVNGCIREKVAVRVSLHRGDRRSYDIDNHFKAIGDALTHAGFWEDDRLVEWLLIERGYVDKENPGAKVEVCSHASLVHDK
jgi:Holliday junction resolvase RusA-like endonuclease